jgi:hypothetical protein
MQKKNLPTCIYVSELSLCSPHKLAFFGCYDSGFLSLGNLVGASVRYNHGGLEATWARLCVMLLASV